MSYLEFLERELRSAAKTAESYHGRVSGSTKPGDPNQGMRVFGRIGGAPSERSTVNFYFDAGINYQGLFPFRDKDVCGIGLSYTKISTGLQDEGGAPVPSHHETIIEGTYQAAITSWFAIQPDIQYVFNPGATGSQRNALVAGIRFSMTF